MCERMCAELLARRRTRLDIVSFLNEYLATRTFDSPPKLKDVAALLNTSERTLKRRLRRVLVLASIQTVDRRGAELCAAALTRPAVRR